MESAKDRISDYSAAKITPARVLFIDHTAMLGGAEIALLNLVRYLDRERFTPIVLLLEHGVLDEKLKGIAETCIVPLDERISKARKDTLGLSTILKAREALGLVLSIIRIARLIRKKKVQLVHTNSLKADIIGGLAARLAGRPVIWHVRDRITEDYLPPLVVKTFRFLSRIVPTYTIAVSEATMRTLDTGSGARKSRSPLNLKRTSVVHDGTEVIPALNSQPKSSITRLGLVGRISPWKGHHIFLRAAAEVYRSHPDTRFYIVGAALFGEHEYEREVHRLVSTLGLGEAVEFTGFCAKVRERIQALDVIVHASTTGEPFGQVIIEGMAAGKPVIATNGGGVPETVVDGGTGILVPMGDVSAMVDAMRWMLDHPQEAEEMGRKGKERVLAQFTMEHCASNVGKVFDRVLRR